MFNESHISLIGKKTFRRSLNTTLCLCVLTEEAARFTKNLSNVEGTETDSVKMICEVSKASAEVTWYKGDDELPEGGRYEQIMDGRKRILIIQDLRMDDVGEYNCRLSPTTRTSAMLKLNGESAQINVMNPK